MRHVALPFVADGECWEWPREEPGDLALMSTSYNRRRGATANAHRPPPQRREPWTPKRLLALRQRYGWSQAELGQAVGVHPGSAARWESGQHAPSRLVCRGLDQLERVGAPTKVAG